MKTQANAANEAPPVLEYAELSGIANEELAQQEEINGAQEQAQAQEQEAEQESNADGWKKAIQYAATVVCSLIPEAAPVWNPAACDNLGEALAKCDEAYGWGGVGGIIEHPLIGLGFASFPLVIGTAKAINAAKARRAVDVDAKEVKTDGDPMAAAADAA